MDGYSDLTSKERTRRRSLTSDRRSSVAVVSLVLVMASCFVSGCYGTSGSDISNSFLVNSTPAGKFNFSTITPGDKQVQLYWQSSLGASSYQMSYGTTSGIYTNRLGTVVTSPTIVTGLTNGVSYYFMVYALNSSGVATPASQEVSSIPALITLNPVADYTTVVSPANYNVNFPVTLGGGSFLSCSTLSATSSNPTLVASNQVTFSGSYPNCQMTTSLSGNVIGSTTVSVHATYGVSTAASDFNINVLPAALAVYSVRKFVGFYTGSAINVRRSSDNATLDIGFTLAGGLDTSALLNFVGSGTGYVTTWYDQSGGGNSAVQATAAQQPKIVNAGVLTTANGLPSLLYSGNQFFQATLSSLNPSTPHTLNGVGIGAGTLVALSGTSGAGSNSVLGMGTSGGGGSFAGWYGGYAQDSPYAAGTANGLLNSLAKTYQSGTITGYFNSVNIFSNSGYIYNLSTANILLGVQNTGGVNVFINGSESEAVVFLSVLADPELQTLYKSQKMYFSTP